MQRLLGDVMARKAYPLRSRKLAPWAATSWRMVRKAPVRVGWVERCGSQSLCGGVGGVVLTAFRCQLKSELVMKSPAPRDVGWRPKRKILVRSVGLFCLPACLLLGLTVRGEARPNVLLITADDLGFQLGCYGDRVVTTPNLDNLADEGVRFTNAYVTSASCSPSRSSVLTGLYPHQNGQLGLSHLGYEMKPGLPSMASLLKKQGYRTGIIGKLHVNPAEDFPFDFVQDAHEPSRSPSRVRQMCDDFFDGAKGEPFFLYLNFFDPHDPFVRDIDGSPKVKVSAEQAPEIPFLGKEVSLPKERIAGFLTCVNRLDEVVGAALGVLKERGLDEDTIIFFISDNGPPFPRAKVTCYEAGVHVPLIISWPEHFKTGVVDELVSSIDLLPTVLALTGAPAVPGLPGLSLLPLLKGEPVEWRQQIFTEYNSHEPRMINPRRAVREGNHKLIMTLLADPDLEWPESLPLEKVRTVQKDAGQGEFLQLYDLENDPHEFNNLAGRPEMKEVQDRLVQTLQEWRRETGDPMTDPVELHRFLEEGMRALDTQRIISFLLDKQRRAIAGEDVGNPNAVTPEEMEKLRASQRVSD